MALPAPETINETMWIVYYVINKKSTNFVIKGNLVDEKFWIDSFSGKDKLSGAIKKLGIESDLSEIKDEIKDMDKIDGAFATKYFIGTAKTSGWHGALKQQVQKFSKNSAVASASKMSIIRQSDFYDKKTNLTKFLHKVWSIFKFRGAYDRWNPADVWFYKPSSITEINSFLKTCSIFGADINRVPPSVQKNLALEDVIALNKLILKLYDERALIPVSLKKSTLYKGEFSYRLGLVNVPQNDMGRPLPPKVTERQLPIKNTGVVGGVSGSKGVDLKYDIEIDQVEYDEKGRKRYVREYDYIGYNEQGKTLGVKKERQFKEAQGGSMGMDLTDKIVYTANGSRAIKELRGKVFDKTLSSDIISAGKFIGKDYEEKLKNAIEYISEMAKELKPEIKNKKIQFATSTAVNQQYIKDQQVIQHIQNKLEIAFAVEKSGIPDEIVLDLWKAITSKGITNRKDYEKIIERIGKGKLEKSRKKGQKRLTQEQADEEARQSLSATRIGDKKKIPGSFHIKLY